MSSTQATLRSPGSRRLGHDRPGRPDLDNIFRFTNVAPPAAQAEAAERRIQQPEQPGPVAGGSGAGGTSDAFRPGPERPKQAPPLAATPERRRGAQPDLDAALDMLNRAARAMDAMQARYRQVEDEAKDVAVRAEQDLAAAVGHARDWEARARAGEATLNDLEDRLSAAEHRAEHAERAVAAVRHWLDAFYDKVLDAFDTCPAPGAAAS